MGRQEVTLSREGWDQALPPPLPTSFGASAGLPLPEGTTILTPTHPTQSTVTHHRTWRPSLACGPRTALLTLPIQGDHRSEEKCPHTGTPQGSPLLPQPSLSAP